MKNEENISRINLRNNFTKTSSSYFIFHGVIKKSKWKKILQLNPIKIIIDGRNSEGYFEPVIELKKNR